MNTNCRKVDLYTVHSRYTHQWWNKLCNLLLPHEMCAYAYIGINSCARRYCSCHWCPFFCFIKLKLWLFSFLLPDYDVTRDERHVSERKKNNFPITSWRICCYAQKLPLYISSKYIPLFSCCFAIADAEVATVY